jgi:cysteine desulfurase
MKLDSPIYLDYNGTTPIDPDVAGAISPFLIEHFGNPSSAHAYGYSAHEAMDTARQRVADLIGASSQEIVFTAGGSESDNLAIHGVAMALKHRGNHIITQQTEHPAVLKSCRYLENHLGFKVTYLPVDRTGLVDPNALADAITTKTVLATIMHANNETGTLQPIAELSAIAHAHQVIFHTDAAQSVGKVSVSVDELGVGLLTIAAHKLYAPKGIGALYVRTGTPLHPLIHGASQEGGRRAGTENVPYMVGLGVACELAKQKLVSDMSRIQELRDRLQQRLAEQGWVLNGHPAQRLPNTLNMSKTGLDGEDILAHTPEIAASTGAACHAGRTEPSAVLVAMGIPYDQALGAIRLSLGRWTTKRQVEQVAEALGRAVSVLSQKHQESV